MTREVARPDDPELGSESAYRRRQRAVAVSRRSGPRWRRPVRWAAKAAAIILPAALLIGTLAWYVTNSTYFALTGPDAVIVTGNHYVTTADVAVALGTGAEPNLFRISLDNARRQVEGIAWVKSATLRRVYPNHLEVKVVERQPIAFVNLPGGLSLVDADGVLLEKPAEASFDFPVLSGIDGSMSRASRKARLALFQQFAQELKSHPSGAGWLISEVDLSDDGDLKALLVQGHQTILVHFGDSDFGERFERFLALLPQAEKAAPDIDSVDLRYRGQVVVNPKEPGRAAARSPRAAP